MALFVVLSALLVACIVGAFVVVQWVNKRLAAGPRLPAAPREAIFIPRGQVKRVAVIGAGASGIAAAKEALAGGLEVVVFEQTDSIGGNWVFKPDEAHSSVYRSTFINTSRQMMAYSDYPMPDQLPTYPHHRQIVKYFNDYADHFGVRAHIRFRTQVLSVARSDDGGGSGGGWTVRWQALGDADAGKPLYLRQREGTLPAADAGQCEHFDAVMVCNGHHSVPRMPSPKFAGQDDFEGLQMHSHAYKQPTTAAGSGGGYDFTDKRVLVVGIGNSGVDIANELSRVSRQVYLSTRSGAWILPKYLFGWPLDHLSPPTLLHYLLSEQALHRLFGGLFSGMVSAAQGSPRSWGLRPQAGIFDMHPTISHELLHRVGTGTVVFRPQVASFETHGVRFVDGTYADIDAVIYCTGYHISFPFLADGVVPVDADNHVALYKHVFPTATTTAATAPPTLAVIGLIQPLGAIMPISEMQARWVVRVLSGAQGLPSADDMRAAVAHERHLKSCYLDRPRHTIQVWYQTYMDDIARLIGALPRWNDFPRLKWRALFSPPVPFIYRLSGPGRVDGADKLCLKTFYQIRHERPEKEASAAW